MRFRRMSGRLPGGLVRGMAAAALLASVCGCAGMIREGRKTENIGIEIRGGLDEVVSGVENTLRNDGYEVVIRPNAKGPGAGGSEISCFRLRGVTREQYRVMKFNGKFRNTIQYHGAIQAEMDQMAVRLTGAEMTWKNYERLKQYREANGIRSDSATGTSDRLVIDASKKWDPATDYQGEVPGVVVLKLDLLSCSLHFEELLEDCRQDVNGGKAIEEVLTVVVGYMRSHQNSPAWQAVPAPVQPTTPAPVFDVDGAYRKAAELYTAGDYTGAWGKASEVVRAKPDHWEGWQLLGNCQYAQGDRKAAISSYDYSLALHPDNPHLREFVDKLKVSGNP